MTFTESNTVEQMIPDAVAHFLRQSDDVPIKLGAYGLITILS